MEKLTITKLKLG